MRRINHTRLAPAAVVVSAWLSSFAPQASAAPIELGNDADVSWQNNPNCLWFANTPSDRRANQKCRWIHGWPVSTCRLSKTATLD